MNARKTRENFDFTEEINLDRYICLPNESNGSQLPLQKNNDKILNHYGQKLLSLLKENSFFICNGRLEEGKCTYHRLYRNKPVLSIDHKS